MEKQCQVLAFLHWQSKWWLNRQSLIPTDDPMLEEGLKAYAQRQAAIRADLGKHFVHIWRNSQKYLELADNANEGSTSITNM